MNPDRIEEYIASRELPEPRASLDGRIDRLLTTSNREPPANRNRLVVTLGAAVAACLCLAVVAVSVAVLDPEKNKRLVGSPEPSAQRSESVQVGIPSLGLFCLDDQKMPTLGRGDLRRCYFD